MKFRLVHLHVKFNFSYQQIILCIRRPTNRQRTFLTINITRTMAFIARNNPSRLEVVKGKVVKIIFLSQNTFIKLSIDIFNHYSAKARVISLNS